MEKREIAEKACSRHALRCLTWVLSTTCCLKRRRAKLSISCRILFRLPNLQPRLRRAPPGCGSVRQLCQGLQEAGAGSHGAQLVLLVVVSYASPNFCAFQVGVKIKEVEEQFISMHIRKRYRTARMANSI